MHKHVYTYIYIIYRTLANIRPKSDLSLLKMQTKERRQVCIHKYMYIFAFICVYCLHICIHGVYLHAHIFSVYMCSSTYIIHFFFICINICRCIFIYPSHLCSLTDLAMTAIGECQVIILIHIRMLTYMPVSLCIYIHIYIILILTFFNYIFLITFIFQIFLQIRYTFSL
jgi:hypothetical protein